MSAAAFVPASSEAGTAARDELLSLEALLVARAYAYELFHKTFGGEPTEALLAVISSPETEDVLDEYAAESETLANLKAFARGLEKKVGGEGFLDEVRDEFARFFEGPADLPALPWESTYVGNESTVFQASTLAVREAYRAQGLRATCFKRMPDDHVSIMCSFMSLLALRTLDALRSRDGEAMRALLAAQRAFVDDHMANWLPAYAANACHVRIAHLYPQFAQGIAAFAQVESAFLPKALGWVNDNSACGTLSPDVVEYDSSEYFSQVEGALGRLSALELKGIGDNEVSPLD
ncbi:TorD/DmsD family molecular chaperone [Eggerthella timonensis]|uniref:TorD/DmsD family molecular chaperone n=1 Tax=Eggerthella timonensis TaxID=1871008 RepID=UPI000C76B850|nr:molecular chaperone TorD family protein [Eggerthella timonensis]